MNDLQKAIQKFDNLKEQNDILLKESKRLKKEIEKLKEKEAKKEEYFTKYKTLYMKYKHQQNNFEKEKLKLKEIIRLLQAEIVKNVSNENLFKKIDELNIGI